MKLRTYLEHIAGIGIFPVISLLLFFLFFTAFAVWAIRTRRQHFDPLGRLPLDDASYQDPSHS